MSRHSKSERFVLEQVDTSHGDAVSLDRKTSTRKINLWCQIIACNSQKLEDNFESRARS